MRSIQEKRSEFHLSVCNRTAEGARLRDMRYIYKSVKRRAEQRGLCG